MKSNRCRLSAVRWIFFAACVMIVLAGCSDSGGGSEAVTDPNPEPAVEAAVRLHTVYLSETIGKRVIGTEGEMLARDYIAAEFEKLGYPARIQEFAVDHGNETVNSANVIATVPGESFGQDGRQVIVGAHYDSAARGAGTGATDNAAGVGAMLVIAGRLDPELLPYTVIFVAFGGEEHVLAEGLLGSGYFVSQMTDQEIEDTVCMINLDTLAGGDRLYVYGGQGEDGWGRDQALDIAQDLGISLETNPGLNAEYPAGTAGDWSDHAPFKGGGIPYVYFESTNWEIGDQDGYEQTAEYGGIWHTDMDTLAFLDSAYPGRIDAQLKSVIMVIEELLYTLNPPTSLKRAGKGAVKPVVKTTRRGIPFDK